MAGYFLSKESLKYGHQVLPLNDGTGDVRTMSAAEYAEAKRRAIASTYKPTIAHQASSASPALMDARTMSAAEYAEAKRRAISAANSINS
jgi:hypothetical protein